MKNSSVLANSQHNNNNTTVSNSDTLYTNIVHSNSSLTNAITSYQQCSYQSLIIGEYQDNKNSAHQARCYASVVKQWFNKKPTSELVDKSNAILLHDYQQQLFSNPIGCGLMPIIDNLAFTLDLSDKQLAKFEKQLKKKSFNGFTLHKTGPVGFLKNCTEKYINFALFRFSDGSHIIIYWGLSDAIRKARPKQRLMKVSGNPARYYTHQTIDFFTWLKGTKAFNYKRIMATANVTRIDTAIDLFGFHLSNLLIDKPNVGHIEYFQNITPDGEVVVGTLKLGSPADSNLIVYDKQHKLINVEDYDIPLLEYRNGELVSITRLERKYKPADGKPIRLADLDLAPYFLTDCKFYSPTVLRELTNKERQSVRTKGFAFWLYFDCERKEEIDELLSKNELHVDNNSLYVAQAKQLKTLKQLILSV